MNTALKIYSHYSYRRREKGQIIAMGAHLKMGYDEKQRKIRMRNCVLPEAKRATFCLKKVEMEMK